MSTDTGILGKADIGRALLRNLKLDIRVHVEINTTPG